MERTKGAKQVAIANEKAHIIVWPGPGTVNRTQVDEERSKMILGEEALLMNSANDPCNFEEFAMSNHGRRE